MLLRRLGLALAGLIGLGAMSPAATLAAVNVSAGERIGQLPGWPAIKAQTTHVEVPRPGVTLSSIELLTSEGMLRVYQMDTDLTAPGISLGSVVAYNSVVSLGETVSSMATRSGAIGGINGDYFAIHTSGVPLNWTVQDGNLIRSGNQWAVFGVTDDHQVNIGKYTWRGSLKVLDSGMTFPIEALNLPLMDHKVIAVTQSMGSALAAKNATLVTLGPVNGEYEVRAVSQGQNKVSPVDGTDVVLAGEGVAATWLAQYVPVGAHVQLDYASHPDWHDLQTAIGGGPILVKDGLPYQDPVAPAAFETNRPYPVSGVGISQDGRMLSMVAVDGHEGRPYAGLTRPQFAWYFQTIGAWNAMAFDSGGSAQLAVRHPGQPFASIVNQPSDGKERQVADGLFVYGS
ncbi:MAG TPA: phosphodiester glycosidase family protein [Chloroflexota bacterium]|nr:phosphodiester glycosidase family protein [Chloroflexota bacterium]